MSFTHDAPGTSATDWSDRAEITHLPRLRLDDGSLTRVVVVAAHPDDESLGAGGVLAHAHRLGLDVHAVIATDGEASHPASPTHSPDRLARRRRAELADAMTHLAPGAGHESLGWPDGRLAEHETSLSERLVDVVGDGRATLLLAPWRRDGHPDHEAAGRAAATAASRTGARLLEYPVWFWHWAGPDDAPWTRLRALDLDPDDRSRKTAAIAAHRSQVQALSERAGDEVLLDASFLDHFGGVRELFVAEPAADGALDDLHASDRDPWGVDLRWYERRKRSVLLAMLLRPRYHRALELGCSTGALAADLATRCDELLAVDASPHAVRAARARLEQTPGATAARLAVPEQWPSGPAFDLVVVSEVGYFLSPVALETLAQRIRASLTQDGVVVLCHWRHDVHGWVLDGPQVHAVLTAADLPPIAAEYRDRDVEILVLADPDLLPDADE